MIKNKKILCAILTAALVSTACTANDSQETTLNEQTSSSGTISDEQNSNTGDNGSDVISEKYKQYASMSAQEIVDSLTLTEKASQMVQPAIYNVSEEEVNANGYGSILSKYETVGYKEWQEIVDDLQKLTLSSSAGIPLIYGQDDVHGVNYCLNAVYFPHNIGLGAVNDPELMYQVGLATADEAKLCHMLWNFAPCVAQSVDPRWGRTYESYGASLDIITSLSTAYTKGLVDGGVVACAKHFFGDGNVTYGTGEKSDADRVIDRGDSTLSDEEISELLAVYQAQIDAGVQTIMIIHSSVNGLKMHENAKYIQYLKNEMGFDGFIVSDWNSVQNTSGKTYSEQVITAINAGIDMLMEVETYNEARDIIVDAVNDGLIDAGRVDDAVRRIIQVKKDVGLFDDPYCDNIITVKSEVGSDDYRKLAQTLVEKSLVLLKNDGDVLPLKDGITIFVTGPAANNAQAQCGGWTIDWNNSPNRNISGVTTILDGLTGEAASKNITVITNKDEADKADVVVLVVGEQAYAEWLGDTTDLELCGELGLAGNREAIDYVKTLGKPVVTCIVAGRQIILGEDYEDWDSVVMCYLPGSEGQGVANVLYGNTSFSGKLPSKWYSSVEQIGTDECWLNIGYGLTY